MGHAKAFFGIKGRPPAVAICLLRRWLFFLILELESWFVKVNQAFYKVSRLLNRFNRLIFVQKFAPMNYRIPNLVDLF